MTEEGCRLTPGCWNAGGPIGGVLHDGNRSYSLNESSLPDPAPGANGIWLGITSTDCYLAPPFNAGVGNHPDIDTDKLDDNCEYTLAKAFAPMLSFSDTDTCPTGEGYWAAKYIDNLEPYHTGDMVKVAYTMSYYNDCGIDTHVGDSELVQLTLGYNPTSHHWEVINSFLSAHICPNDSFSCQWPLNNLGDSQTWGRGFEWPSSRAYGFPRVYVSRGKHANYRSRDACNSGGFLYSDTCTNNHDKGRFIVWESHNLGSHHSQIRNCVETETALALFGIECFWTGTKFRGWKHGAAGVTPYKDVLLSVIFQGTPIDATRWWTGSFGL